jgi:hypothetical protein
VAVGFDGAAHAHDECGVTQRSGALMRARPADTAGAGAEIIPASFLNCQVRHDLFLLPPPSSSPLVVLPRGNTRVPHSA